MVLNDHDWEAAVPQEGGMRKLRRQWQPLPTPIKDLEPLWCGMWIDQEELLDDRPRWMWQEELLDD
jgi:hypothetical protein